MWRKFLRTSTVKTQFADMYNVGKHDDLTSQHTDCKSYQVQDYLDIWPSAIHHLKTKEQEHEKIITRGRSK